MLMETKLTEDVNKGNSVREKMEIFSVFPLDNTRQSHDGSTEADQLEGQEKKRRKKKRRGELKKSSSKVGILPPIKTKLQVDNEPITIEQTTPNTCADDIKRNCRTSKPPTDGKMLKLFTFITHYPVTSFLIASVVHLATILTTAGLLAKGSDVFPLVFDELPLILFNNVRLRELSWRSKTSYKNFVYRHVKSVSYPTWRRGTVKDTVEVIFEEPEGKNLLQQDYLRRIQNAENLLFHNSEFQSLHCTVDYYYDCVKPLSLMRLFDGTYRNVDPVFVDANFSNIHEVIYRASLYNETKDFLDLFLGKDASITADVCHTSITRIFLLMGWPPGWRRGLSRYGTLDDLEHFLVDVFKPAIEYVRDVTLADRLNLYYLSKMMFEADLMNQALSDLQLAIGSFLFIFLFMCFQMGSLTLSALGICSILSSFLLTNLIYRFIFKYIYFGFFHVIAIFLILGIGADDLFVFYDTWRLTGHNEYPTMAHRLSDCYKRAAKTTFVTSVTTMTAFLVSGLSPLLPVATFGIFSGMLVGINYLSVITYFPTVIILHHTKIKGSWYKCHDYLLHVWLERSAHQSVLPRKQEDTVSTDDLYSTVSGNSTEILIIPDKTKETENTVSTRNICEYSQTKNQNLTTLSEIAHHHQKKKKHRKKRHHSKHEVQLSVDTLFKSDENKFLDYNNSQVKDDPHSFTNPDNDLTETSEEVLIGSGLEMELLEERTGEGCTCKLSCRDNEKASQPCTCKTSKEKKLFEDRNKVVVFLKNGFFDFVTKRPIKICVPLIFLGVSIFFIHSATQIQPDTYQIRLFRDNHNYAKASERHYFSFRRNMADEYTRVYIVWGMDKADISDCNLKSAEYCPGKPEWNDQFEVSSQESQLALKELCDRLENISPQHADRLRIRRDSTSGLMQIACFIKPMEKYFSVKFQNMTDISLKIPVDPGNVTAFMQKNYRIYNRPLNQNFSRYFEILLSYWLTNGYTYTETPDYYQYNELLAEQRIDGDSRNAYYTYSGMYYGTRLRYLAVEINTTMNIYSMGYNEGLPVFHEWERLVNDLNSMMPPSLKGAFHVTRDLWHWLHVQETLSSSAKTGILVGLLTAWPILVFTTFNYVIGTLAVMVISLVTCCVVGIIPLAGWKLGVLESINLCMVVGLSVDYVVHLAEAYRMSESTRRLDRVQDMLESIGLSVLSGAITTMGAAIFMLFSQIQFFFQFGIFILSTVGTALLFSILGFTTFMALCGPQNDTGSLRALFRKLVGSEKGAGKKRKGCMCVSPMELLDRLFDWMSYGREVLKSA